METYFIVGQVPPEAFMGFMLMTIVPKHLNEIKEFQNFDYLAFREQLLEVLEKPYLATAYLNALATVTHNREETLRVHVPRSTLGAEGSSDPRTFGTGTHSHYKLHARTSRQATRGVPRNCQGSDCSRSRTTGY